MAGYTLLQSASTVQVISSTLVVDAVVVTAQTSPSGVVATLPIPQEWIDAGTSAEALQTFADSVESLMAETAVLAATGVQSVDENGLLEYAVEFTVGYTSPGSATGPLTKTVDVPVSALGPSIASGFTVSPVIARSLIDYAYAQLVYLAGDGPAPAPPTTGGGLSSGGTSGGGDKIPTPGTLV